jgi:hypothetical protein
MALDMVGSLISTVIGGIGTGVGKAIGGGIGGGIKAFEQELKGDDEGGECEEGGDCQAHQGGWGGQDLQAMPNLNIGVNGLL